MNVPDQLALGTPSVLGSPSICYAPLTDKQRKAVGTWLTTLSTHQQDRPPVGHVLADLCTVRPECSAPVPIAPPDVAPDDSAGD